MTAATRALAAAMVLIAPVQAENVVAAALATELEEAVRVGVMQEALASRLLCTLSSRRVE